MPSGRDADADTAQASDKMAILRTNDGSLQSGRYDKVEIKHISVKKIKLHTFKLTWHRYKVKNQINNKI